MTSSMAIARDRPIPHVSLLFWGFFRTEGWENCTDGQLQKLLQRKLGADNVKRIAPLGGLQSRASGLSNARALSYS